ncbi:hypothetical protein D3C80_862730 [compost metagenome]
MLRFSGSMDREAWRMRVEASSNAFAALPAPSSALSPKSMKDSARAPTVRIKPGHPAAMRNTAAPAARSVTRAAPIVVAAENHAPIATVDAVWAAVTCVVATASASLATVC